MKINKGSYVIILRRQNSITWHDTLSLKAASDVEYWIDAEAIFIAARDRKIGIYIKLSMGSIRS